MNVLPTKKKPSFHRVTSASSASRERTARAKSNPSDDEPMKSAGFDIVLFSLWNRQSYSVRPNDEVSRHRQR